jgi:hypothetical protein
LPLCIALLVSCGRQAEKEETPVTSALTTQATEFVTLLAQGDFVNAVMGFDSTMITAWPPHKLEKAWASLIGQVGAFKRQVSTREAEEMGFNVVYVTCDFEKGPLDIKVVFNAAKKISGLWFMPVK